METKEFKIGDIVEHINKESKSGYPHDKKYVVYGFCRMKILQLENGWTVFNTPKLTN